MGIPLSVISNWIYDFLKDHGVLPNRPSLRIVSIVLFFMLPTLVVLVALPEMMGQEAIASIPDEVIASEMVIACMQQHEMKQASEVTPKRCTEFSGFIVKFDRLKRTT